MMKKWIILLFVLVLLVPAVMAATVERSFTSPVIPGADVVVTLTITADSTDQNLAVTDIFPTGWVLDRTSSAVDFTILNQAPGAPTPVDTRVALVLLGGRSIPDGVSTWRYTVAAPSSVTTGTFAGTFSDTTQGNSNPITGASTITVESATPPSTGPTTYTCDDSNNRLTIINTVTGDPVLQKGDRCIPSTNHVVDMSCVAPSGPYEGNRAAYALGTQTDINCGDEARCDVDSPECTCEGNKVFNSVTSTCDDPSSSAGGYLESCVTSSEEDGQCISNLVCDTTITGTSLCGCPRGQTWNAESGACRIPAPIDSDGDSVADTEDNCPAIANANQADRNGDGVGDACEQIIAGTVSVGGICINNVDCISDVGLTCANTIPRICACSSGVWDGDSCEVPIIKAVARDIISMIRSLVVNEPAPTFCSGGIELADIYRMIDAAVAGRERAGC